MYFMHKYLSHKYLVRVLKFASLQPNQNRYEDAYREVRFRTNCEFSASTAVQENSQETSQQGLERVFLLLEALVCAHVMPIDGLRHSQGTHGYNRGPC